MGTCAYAPAITLSALAQQQASNDRYMIVHVQEMHNGADEPVELYIMQNWGFGQIDRKLTCPINLIADEVVLAVSLLQASDVNTTIAGIGTRNINDHFLLKNFKLTGRMSDTTHTPIFEMKDYETGKKRLVWK